jgi:hypothetical protein
MTGSSDDIGMRRRVSRTVLASCLAVPATLLPCEAAIADRFVEYLHIEAGSGASGGGHAGLRIGDTTYHYVYAEPGLIESAAESNEDFEYAYRALANRSIHVSRIATSDRAYEALADSFERRHITQQAQLELLEATVDDHALAAYLYEQRCLDDAAPTSVRSPRLRGAGYFVSATRPAPASELRGGPGEIATLLTASPLAQLRTEIERVYGSNYLTQKSQRIARELRNLRFPPAEMAPIAQWTIPVHDNGFAERFTTYATAGVALDVLLHERAPLPGAYRLLDDPADRLTDPELAVLAARVAHLQSSLVRLAASKRSDWGYPMLVGMARLVALEASLQAGRLVVPDSFDDAASWVPVEKLLADAPVVDALLAERRVELDAARVALLAATPNDEAAWSRLEVAVSARRELGDAVELGKGPVRAYSDTMLPSRSAELDETWPLPAADCETLARWTTSAKNVADTRRGRLREIYRYDVVSRNCVTEIFRTIQATGAVFGANTGPEAGLGFIPFVSATAVNESYPVAERSTLPSYRRYWLARLRETEGSARTTLRESNTITATLRHPDERDDVFLFYTEDATLLRPLYGAVNTGIGAGATLAGLATLPFDGGRLLTRGARSFVFSVPELAFVNFRKGRNGVLPRDWMQARAEDRRTGGTGVRLDGDPLPQSPSATPRERAVVTASPSSGTFF